MLNRVIFCFCFKRCTEMDIELVDFNIIVVEYVFKSCIDMSRLRLFSFVTIGRRRRCSHCRCWW